MTYDQWAEYAVGRLKQPFVGVPSDPLLKVHTKEEYERLVNALVVELFSRELRTIPATRRYLRTMLGEVIQRLNPIITGQTFVRFTQLLNDLYQTTYRKNSSEV